MQEPSHQPESNNKKNLAKEHESHLELLPFDPLGLAFQHLQHALDDLVELIQLLDNKPKR